MLLYAQPASSQQTQATAKETQSSGQQAPQSTPVSDKSGPSAAQSTPKSTSDNNRLFEVLPNYATVESEQQYSPITAKQKFKLSVDSLFDPVTFPFIGMEALISQAQNSEPSYGQGLEGYGKRYGTAYADAAIGTTMTTSVFPSLLHQDPRYFQLGKGPIWRRAMHSVSRIFVTQSDSGNTQFNVSEILGNAVAAGISNTYHPRDERTLTNTASVWGTDVMWDAISNAAKEFWPDIHRKLHKKKNPD